MIHPEKYYPFSLTDEQKVLFEALLAFFASDDNVFIVKGYAGTGKTSIVLGLVKYLEEQKRPFYLLASTGRASKVLAEKARYPASTLHSAIYVVQIAEVKPKYKGGPEYRVGFKLKSPNPISNAIYFVDESSMLSNSFQKGGDFVFGSGYLLTDFFRYIGEGKVVFIGDPAQLPPVNAKFSAALSKTFLTEHFGLRVREFFLKKVMRYAKDSGMYFNTSMLRNVVESSHYPPVSLKASGFRDIERFRHENDLIKRYYDTIQKYGVDNAIYITYTNKTAAFANRKIRIHLWGTQKAQKLQVNESLMVVRNNQAYGLSNGDLITVDSIEKHVTRRAGLTFQNIAIRVPDPDPQKGMVIKNVMILTDLLDDIQRDLSYEQDMALLKDFFIRMRHTAHSIYSSVSQMQGVDEEAFQVRIEQLARKNKVILGAGNLSQSLPGKNAFTKQLILENMRTDPYLNALRVKYGYAVTCHKSQGSEWPHVFIHFERALGYMDYENLYRWVYTAISRAGKKLYLLDTSFIY